MDFNFLLDVVIPATSFLMGCLTTTLFWIQGYANKKAEAEVKRYAAERDFGHLKRNYENLSIAIADLVRAQEEGFDRLADLIKEGK